MKGTLTVTEVTRTGAPLFPWPRHVVSVIVKGSILVSVHVISKMFWDVGVGQIQLYMTAEHLVGSPHS